MITPESLSGHRCVVVSNLRLSMFIGVLPHEHDAPQQVIVSVWTYVPESGLALSERMEDYVSYADVVAGIQTVASEGHIELVENFAEQIAQMVLSDDRVARVVVDVRKPDIIEEADSVGVIIERSRAPA